jgi:hypothetical protein
MPFKGLIVVAVVVLACAGAAFGQMSVFSAGGGGKQAARGPWSVVSGEPKAVATPTPITVIKDPDLPQQRPAPTPQIRRWIELDSGNLATRYRYIDQRNGQINVNQQQWQLQLKGRFKLDAKGKYSIYFGLETGRSYTSGWDTTGWGTGLRQTQVAFKHLYFDAKPLKGLEMQVGSLFVNNGENTEITTYDNDGWITGERVQIRRPKEAWFDEISVTNAYFGDVNLVNFFKRTNRFGHPNYRQLLVKKQVNKIVGFSADYTYEVHHHTLREAVRFKIPKDHWLDTVLFENYQRVSPDHGYGFNLFGDKALSKTFTLNGGFAHIDRSLLGNADRFPVGNRAYIGAVWKIRPDLTFNPVYVRSIGPLLAPTTHRQRVDLILTYSFLTDLKAKHWL